MSETAQAHGDAATNGGRGDHTHHGHRHHADPAKTARDPVCGMGVNPETSKHRFEHQGQTYYFCCNGCRTKFEADPQKYLAPKAEAPKPGAGQDAIYTCPVHPETRQVGPGSSPICGMALEPLEITAETGPNHELVDMTR